MIFVTDADGRVSFVSSEWSVFTGKDAASATDNGWLDAVHPADRKIAINLVRNAHAQQSEYSFRHRLRRADGSYAWVAGGAVPSFGPPGRTFLGYLGSLTEFSSSGTEPLAAYGTLRRYVPPPSNSGTQHGPTLEMVADHLLIAHGLIEQDHAKEMLPVLRQALVQIGLLLASSMKMLDYKSRIH